MAEKGSEGRRKRTGEGDRKRGGRIGYGDRRYWRYGEGGGKRRRRKRKIKGDKEVKRRRGWWEVERVTTRKWGRQGGLRGERGEEQGRGVKKMRRTDKPKERQKRNNDKITDRQTGTKPTRRAQHTPQPFRHTSTISPNSNSTFLSQFPLSPFPLAPPLIFSDFTPVREVKYLPLINSNFSCLSFFPFFFSLSFFIRTLPQ